MKRGYIYNMWSKTDDKLVYFGSTTQKLSKRITDHHRNYKYWKKWNKDAFTRSYLIFDAGDWDYMCVEEVEFNDPRELRERERWYIENNECVNKNIPNRSQKESHKNWLSNNKEKCKEYGKEYREQNKEYWKEWRKNNKEKCKEYAKEYQKNNKEKCKEYQKEWYEKTKAFLSERITCPCGCIVSRSGLSRHKKSAKHLRLLEEKLNELNEAPEKVPESPKSP